MTRLAGWLIAGVLLSGLAVLAHQAMVVAGRPGAGLEPSTILRLLGRAGSAPSGSSATRSSRCSPSSS